MFYERIQITSGMSQSPPPAKRRRICDQNEKLGFPEPILYYLKKNSDPKLLLKLMQISKYFCYKEFPFMVVKDLKYVNNFLSTYNPLNPAHNYDGKKDFWITNSLYVDIVHSCFASILISKVAVCDIKILHLEGQKLTMEEFEFFNLEKISEISLYNTVITKEEEDDEEEEVFSFVEIVKMLPIIEEFNYGFQDNPLLEATMTPETTKNFIEFMKNFYIVVRFCLNEIPETFDFDAFVQFALDNEWANYYLQFSDNISDEYVQKLQAGVDKIIQKYLEDGFRSTIYFPDQTLESMYMLEDLRIKFDERFN